MESKIQVSPPKPLAFGRYPEYFYVFRSSTVLGTRSFIHDNPLDGLRLSTKTKKKNRAKDRLIDENDLWIVIEHLKECPTITAIIFVAIFTGMRISETLGLRIKDINFKNGELTVENQSSEYKERDSDGNVTKRYTGDAEVKTQDSNRDLGFGKLVHYILVTRLNELAKLNKPELLEPDAYIFCNRKGKLRTYSGTRSIFVRFMQKIGLHEKGYTLHSFRHSFASHTHASGIDLDTLSAYMGHADSKITKEVYTHLTKRANREVANAVDTVFARRFGNGFTANFTATVLHQECQNEPKTANREKSEVRSWVPTVVKSGTDTRGKSI